MKERDDSQRADRENNSNRRCIFISVTSKGKVRKMKRTRARKRKFSTEPRWISILIVFEASGMKDFARHLIRGKLLSLFLLCVLVTIGFRTRFASSEHISSSPINSDDNELAKTMDRDNDEELNLNTLSTIGTHSMPTDQLEQTNPHQAMPIWVPTDPHEDLGASGAPNDQLAIATRSQTLKRDSGQVSEFAGQAESSETEHQFISVLNNQSNIILNDPGNLASQSPPTMAADGQARLASSSSPASFPLIRSRVETLLSENSDSLKQAKQVDGFSSSLESDRANKRLNESSELSSNIHNERQHQPTVVSDPRSVQFEGKTTNATQWILADSPAKGLPVSSSQNSMIKRIKNLKNGRVSSSTTDESESLTRENRPKKGNGGKVRRRKGGKGKDKLVISGPKAAKMISYSAVTMKPWTIGPLEALASQTVLTATQSPLKTAPTAMVRNFGSRSVVSNAPIFLASRPIQVITGNRGNAVSASDQQGTVVAAPILNNKESFMFDASLLPAKFGLSHLFPATVSVDLLRQTNHLNGENGSKSGALFNSARTSLNLDSQSDANFVDSRPSDESNQSDGSSHLTDLDYTNDKRAILVTEDSPVSSAASSGTATTDTSVLITDSSNSASTVLTPNKNQNSDIDDDSENDLDGDQDPFDLSTAGDDFATTNSEPSGSLAATAKQLSSPTSTSTSTTTTSTPVTAQSTTNQNKDSAKQQQQQDPHGKPTRLDLTNRPAAGVEFSAEQLTHKDPHQQQAEHELLVGPFKSESEAPATITLSGVVYQKSGASSGQFIKEAGVERDKLADGSSLSMSKQQQQHLGSGKSVIRITKTNTVDGPEKFWPAATVIRIPHSGATSLAHFSNINNLLLDSLQQKATGLVDSNSQSMDSSLAIKDFPSSSASLTTTKYLPLDTYTSLTGGGLRLSPFPLASVSALLAASSPSLQSGQYQLGQIVNSLQGPHLEELALLGPAKQLRPNGGSSSGHQGMGTGTGTGTSPNKPDKVHFKPESSNWMQLDSGSASALLDATQSPLSSDSSLRLLGSGNGSGGGGGNSISSQLASNSALAQLDQPIWVSSGKKGEHYYLGHSNVASTSSSAYSSASSPSSTPSLASPGEAASQMSESKHSKEKSGPIVIVQKDVKPVKYHLLRAYLKLRRLLRPFEATYVFPNDSSPLGSLKRLSGGANIVRPKRKLGIGNGNGNRNKNRAPKRAAARTVGWPMGKSGASNISSSERLTRVEQPVEQKQQQRH